MPLEKKYNYLFASGWRVSSVRRKLFIADYCFFFLKLNFSFILEISQEVVAVFPRKIFKIGILRTPVSSATVPFHYVTKLKKTRPLQIIHISQRENCIRT